MSKVNIKGTEYKLKFSIGFWRQIKEQCEVTSHNLETKLRDDFGIVAAQVVYWGIQYGLGLPKESPVTIEDIEAELDRSVVDAIEAAIIAGMTKEEKRLVELARKQREAKIQEVSDEIDDGKKKLPSTSTDS